MAELHPQLANDCTVLGQLPLCRILLMRDANYPWLILVPDRVAVKEIYQLVEDDQQQLMRESSAVAEILAREFNADKINIGALGNMVPQLHVHHIVRYKTDSAWPAPVWGACPAKPYGDAELAEMVEKLKTVLSSRFDFIPVP